MTKFVYYRVNEREAKIRPAPLERDWMQATPQGFAYRCLPLNIANACGWEVLCETAFEAWWTGETGVDAIRIAAPRRQGLPISHFGSGVLTFHLHGLFKTAPGVNLFATGPVNRPKDGIAPLSGVVETDWAPYTFTMNWRFTRPNAVVRFEEDEPFCLLMPIDLKALEAVEPEVRPITDDPDLERRFRAWSKDRNTFNADLKRPASEAAKKGWQKDYFHGRDADGRAAQDHRTRLRLKPFVAKPGTKP